MTDLQELHKLPQLTKDDLVGHADELLAINFTENELHRSATGGSTGRHTPFFRDNACRSRKLANQYRHMCWAGWRPGQRVSLYWPALQDVGHSQTLKQWIKETWITRQQMLYAGQLDEEILAKHAASMSRFRPALIRAFPNPLSILARYLQDNGIKIRPRGIITVGEPLLPGQRSVIRRSLRLPCI